MDIEFNFGKRFETRCLAYLLMFTFVSYFLNMILQEGLKIGISISPFFYGIALAISAFIYCKAINRFKMSNLAVLLFFLVGTIFFCILNKNSIQYIYISFAKIAYSPSLILFFFCMPVFFLINSGRIDFKLLCNSIALYSRIILISLLISYFIFKIGTGSLGTTYMAFSYNALVATCVCFSHRSKNNLVRIFDKLLALASCFVIAFAGARGALLCIIFFLCVWFITSQRISYNKKIVIFLVCSISCLIFIIFSNQIIGLINSFLASKGIYSRTIEKITSGNFINGSDRFELWANDFETLKKSPIFGFGLWGDRPIVKGYSHNLFVELLCSFGYLFGSIIIIIIISNLLKVFFDSKSLNIYKKNLFIWSLPFGFFQLMFSDSYLMNVWFFLLIGFLFAFKKIKTNDELDKNLEISRSSNNE